MRRGFQLAVFCFGVLLTAGVLGLLEILILSPTLWIVLVAFLLLGMVSTILWEIYGGHPID